MYTAKDIYKQLIKAGVTDVDALTFFEIEAIIDAEYEKFKDQWEQTRFIAYIMAQTQSTKSLKPQDILKFAWDGEDQKFDTQEAKLRAAQAFKELQEDINKEKKEASLKDLIYGR
jgi:hypothetical protein